MQCNGVSLSFISVTDGPTDGVVLVVLVVLGVAAFKSQSRPDRRRGAAGGLVSPSVSVHVAGCGRRRRCWQLRQEHSLSLSLSHPTQPVDMGTGRPQSPRPTGRGRPPPPGPTQFCRPAGPVRCPKFLFFFFFFLFNRPNNYRYFYIKMPKGRKKVIWISCESLPV